MKTILLFAATTALVSCARAVRVTTGAPSAAMVAASGEPIGTLAVQATSNGVRIRGNLRNLSPGAHGIHVHAVGACTTPDFQSAGAHLNPASRQHGLENPSGSHAGDLANITADAAGNATVDLTSTNLALSEITDADGSAIVVHAAADDQRTDPSGNSGARVACGVVR
jgi:Cu-Zn family superoxide dismutase